MQQAKGHGAGRFRKRSAFDRHPATRTFQALRIAVNREHEALAALLRDLPWMLAPGGRAALLTFHSGEERAVGRALADGLAAGLWASADAEPLRPSPDEVRANPRSRSARLWRAVRAAGTE
ncbi:MAG: Ribosomal RNA small subunit methyltransferase H [Planctomycetes bacterium]|nr:Ribosomal RNA small subunit methyltransferase H [Planctomycetota bacterium]